MSTVSDKQEKLVTKLKELFQMDQADLDFGLYRIMNAKHDEIDRFLQDDLLPTIRTVLSQNGKADSVKKELSELVKTVQAAGMNPDDSPKVQELKTLLGEGATASIERDEDEIFSQLTTFFGRYYDGGDFMSLRRYKKETYSPLPMNGEEVKLHWANADQYYIKSGENFQTYVFKVGEGNDQISIRFELVKACTEYNNNKAATDKERRFMLNQETPFKTVCEDGVDVLVLPFCYVPDTQKRTQKVLNAEAASFLAGLKGDEDVLKQVKDQWADLKAALLSLAPTEKNKKRTAFEKHLGDYTAKNSFDYFIHKDLGGFLRRELDFFIKNEMLYLDNIIPASVEGLDRHVLSNETALKKLVAFKTIALKIIAFLAQLEEFQKKLWLKKKFVLETNYCLTLDRVPETFYERITDNQAQVQEWVALGFMDEGTQVTEAFLKQNPFLVLDTGRFDEGFKTELLASIEDIDAQTDGLLVHSENFQALSLMQERYKEQVKCVYIDPPYNTGEGDFVYKDSYSDSSWLTFIKQSTFFAKQLMKYNAVFHSSIGDKNEIFRESNYLDYALSSIFGKDCWLNKLTIVRSNNGMGSKEGFASNHEYIYVYKKNKDAQQCFRGNLPSKEYLSSFNKKDDFGIYKADGLLRKKGGGSRREDSPGCFYPIFYSPETGRCSLSTFEGSEKVYPKLPDGGDGRWVWGTDFASDKEYKLLAGKNGTIYIKDYLTDDRRQKPKSTFINPDYITDKATNEIKDLFVEKSFPTPKPIKLILDLIDNSTLEHSKILDYFAGSGTTAHATINLNRADGGTRKYILVEMGNYFDTVLMPRIKKVVFSEKWKEGKPVPDPKKGKEDNTEANALGGISHCFKYIRLESYEDVMDNLALTRTADQSDLLAQHDTFREDYMLHYMLDIEAKGSLLSPKLFDTPFSATMKVVRDNEARNQNIDLVETFNWLLGLTLISTRSAPVTKTAHIVEVIGTNRAGENILILWRTIAQNAPDYIDNDALDTWFKKQDYNTRDMEFDLIYVNGDNNLPNLKKANENWKVQLTEHVFETLMFDVSDV